MRLSSLVKASRFHYAWVVLASVMTIQAVSSGSRFSFAVMVDPLVERFGWTPGEISLAYSLAFISGIPITLLAGRLGDRIGGQRLIMIAAAGSTVSLLLLGTVTQLWQFYLYYGILLGGLGNAIFVTLLPVAVSHWFDKRLGLAMGLMWASISLGQMLLSPLLRWGFDTLGWQETMTATGIVSGFLLAGTALFFRDRPQQVGLSPYGAREAMPVAGIKMAPPSISFSQVARTPVFWVLTFSHFVGCLSHSIMLAHMVSIAIQAKILPLAAASIMSVSSFSALGSRFGMSLLSEAKGWRLTLGMSLFLQSTPILILLWSQSLPIFYLSSALFGLGLGGEMVGYPIFNRQIYGLRAPLGTIYSFQLVGAIVGMALGGWLGGALFDMTGSYNWSLLAAALSGYLGLIPILVLPRQQGKPLPSEVR